MALLFLPTHTTSEEAAATALGSDSVLAPSLFGKATTDDKLLISALGVGGRLVVLWPESVIVGLAVELSLVFDASDDEEEG